MFTTESLLEYFIVVYVMVVVIMIVLYLVEHFEIRFKKNTDCPLDRRDQQEQPLTNLANDYENNLLWKWF